MNGIFGDKKQQILHSWAGIGVFNKIEKIKKIKKFFVVWKISIFGANVLLPGFGMQRAGVFCRHGTFMRNY